MSPWEALGWTLVVLTGSFGLLIIVAFILSLAGLLPSQRKNLR